MFLAYTCLLFILKTHSLPNVLHYYFVLFYSLTVVIIKLNRSKSPRVSSVLIGVYSQND